MRLAKETYFAIRRVPPLSSHWRRLEKQPTSGAFGDKSGKLSVDLIGNIPDKASLESRYKSFIETKGIGLAISVVKPINDVLKSQEILDEEAGEAGQVFHEPLDDNPDHGIVTGRDGKRKQKALKSVFDMMLEPQDFSKIYP